MSHAMGIVCHGLLVPRAGWDVPERIPVLPAGMGCRSPPHPTRGSMGPIVPQGTLRLWRLPLEKSSRFPAGPAIN